MKMSIKWQNITKKILLVILSICFLLVFCYWPVIFQRGNPIPYLVSATSLNDAVKFVEIKENLYISERSDSGVYPELFEFIEKSYNAEFVEQGGSAFIFSNGNETFALETEIYFSDFMVWELVNLTKQI